MKGVSHDPGCSATSGLEEAIEYAFLIDQICFFKNQLRVKIQCDRKCLDRVTFDEKWMKEENLFVRRGATLKSSLSPPLAHGYDSLGPLMEAHPIPILYTLVSSMIVS